MAWTPEQYLEAWRREKRRERGGRRRERRSFGETVVEGDEEEEEEEEELIHVVADGEQMRSKGEGERKNRMKEGKEGETCTEGEPIIGEERRGRRVDSELSRHSR